MYSGVEFLETILFECIHGTGPIFHLDIRTSYGEFTRLPLLHLAWGRLLHAHNLVAV